MFSLSARRSVLAFAVAFGGAPLAGGAAEAQGASPLSAFVGYWSGSGTLSHQTGATERIECQAVYAPRSADDVQQRLDCRSDSTAFRLVSNVVAQGSRLRGDWTETTRNVRGAVTGTLRPNLIEGQVQGPGFSASIAIVLRGGRQTVEIRSNTGDISDLHIVLSRTSG